MVSFISFLPTYLSFLLFLLIYKFFSTPLSSFPSPSTLSNDTHTPNLLWKYPFSPSYVDSCISHLTFSLLYRVPGVLNNKLVLFALFCVQKPLKTENILYLSFWIWVTSLNMIILLDPFMSMQISRMSLIFTIVFHISFIYSSVKWQLIFSPDSDYFK